MRLEGRTIFITGGTSGIGLALAEAFVARRNRVIICGRSPHRLDRVRYHSPGIETLECDVAREDELRRLADLLGRDYPDLDIVINNAGVMRFFDVVAEREDLYSIENEIAINLLAPIRLTELLLPKLLHRAEAAIVNVSSGLAFAQLAAAPVYCATKAALHSWSRSLRLQLDRTPVRVFEVLPPRVQSDLGRHMKRGSFGRAMSAEKHAQIVIAGMEKNRYEIAPGGSRFLDFASRVVRGPIERGMWSATRRLIR